MKVFKGYVTSIVDANKSGVFSVILYGQSDKFVPVTYTSPMYSIGEGGYFQIPSMHSEVLVLFDEDLGEYFYLCTLVSKPRFSPKSWSDKKNLFQLINKRNLYSLLGIPRAVTLTDQKGAGLIIQNFYEDQGLPDWVVNSAISKFRPPKAFLDPRVQLQSAGGHKVILSDNPEMDRVEISNKHNDRIVLTADTTSNNPYGKNSIEIATQGSHRISAQTGEYRVTLKDGSDITLENQSTGSNVSLEGKDKSGNINLRSQNKDINIYTEGAAGKILLTCVGAGSVIQLNCNGDVSIYSQGNITVRSGGSINFVADGDINLNSGGNVNIRGSSSTALTSSSGDVTVGGQAGTNVGVTGKPLKLNSGISTPSPNLDTPEPLVNAYGK